MRFLINRALANLRAFNRLSHETGEFSCDRSMALGCLRQILRFQPNSRTGRHVGALTAPNAATKVTKTRKHETRKTGKSIEHLAPVHHAQILNYMRVVRMRAGLLMNFNVALLAEGMRRKVL